MFLHGGIAIGDLPLQVYSCFVYYLYMVGGSRNPFGFLGSVRLGSFPCYVLGITALRFLTFSMHCLQALAMETISEWICGHHINLARASITACPGCLWWIVANTNCFKRDGITMRLS